MKTPMSAEKHQMLAAKVGMKGEDWTGDDMADEVGKTMDAMLADNKAKDAKIGEMATAHKAMGDDLAEHKKKVADLMESAKSMAEENKQAKAVAAASATPQILSAMEQDSLTDSVTNIAERIVRKGLMTPKSVDGIVAPFKTGNGFAVVAASAAPGGTGSLLRSVLLAIDAAEPGVPTGPHAIVAASPGITATNPPAPVVTDASASVGKAAAAHFAHNYTRPIPAK